MNRLTAAVFAAATLGVFVVGLALASPIPAGSGPTGAHAAPSAQNLELWMSNAEDGDPVQSVVSTTNRVWAVTSFENAASERYVVQLRDLAGIVVAAKPVLLDGTGRESVSVVVTDFVKAYTEVMDAGRKDNQGNCLSPSCTLQETVTEADANCESVPDVPPTWPEPPVQPTAAPGQPTPTPAPDVWALWSNAQLSLLATGQSAAAEVTRTVQSMLAMPDVRADAQLQGDLQTAQADLIQLRTDLEQAKDLINPPTDRPKPADACAMISDSVQQIDAVSTRLNQVVAAAADVSDWRLPPTGSRWQGQAFLGCVQYNTELLPVVGNEPSSAPVETALWSVGEPGKPRLVFPGVGLVEPVNEGEIEMVPVGGGKDIYAQSVMVPDVSHTALLSAYVTDRDCIPVTGVTMTFGVTPVDSATVSPLAANITNGVASAELEAGNDAVNRGQVTGFVATGGGSGVPEGITGIASFDVIGAASAKPNAFQFRVGRRTINIVKNERLAFSVQVQDEFYRNVADGTLVHISIPEADPAVLAYEQWPLTQPRPGRPTPTPELVTAGKSLEMHTAAGLTQLEPPDDPGMTRKGPFLVCTGVGEVTLAAQADGVTASTDTEEGLKTVKCVRRYDVELPLTFMNFDIYAHPTALPIETATPTAQP
jgi:hypothetical protein